MTSSEPDDPTNAQSINGARGGLTNDEPAVDRSAVAAGAVGDPIEDPAEDRAAVGPPRAAEPRSAPDLPSAFEVLDQLIIAGRAKRLALFMDFDGTLSPIEPVPEMAEFNPVMRRLVERLAECTQVAIVSGRGLADLRAHVGIPGLTYAGSHGYELQRPDGACIIHADGESFRRDLGQVAGVLTERLLDVRGARVEPKPFAVAIHFRLVPEGMKKIVENCVFEVARDFPALRVTGGKQVLEFRPRGDWHKGALVDFLLNERADGGVRPVYIGDDLTDEDAFAMIRGRGIGIFVGDPRGSAATHRLEDVPQVGDWLEQLRTGLAADEFVVDPAAPPLSEAAMAASRTR